MKILSINKHDALGGAAVAAYRLHESMLKRGIASELLVDNKITSDRLVSILNRKRLFESVTSRISGSFGLNYINIGSTWQIASHPLYKEADVVALHNLHEEFFNYLAIPSISRNKPTIFSLHDMWSFTGHCASSLDCNRWALGCGRCPYLDGYPAIKVDATRLEWHLKKWVYSRSKLAVVVPSFWLEECVKKSILNCFPVFCIPHGLDLDIYHPLKDADLQACREAIGIPHNKKVVMIGAASLGDPLKGGSSLIQAMQKIPQSLKSEIVLMSLGQGGRGLESYLDIPIISLGYVGGESFKALAYSIADIFVSPTRAEVFGLMLLESMACGTPMVSFSVGGVSELVRPGVTGLLAQPEDPTDLAAKIVELLEDDALRHQMGQNCRQIAMAEYSIELQADRYIALCQQVIETFHSPS